MRLSAWFITGLIIAIVPSLTLAQKADIILYNGKVVTVDANFTIAEAVAVRADRILAVGKSAEILQLADESTQKVDLKGKTVIPGLIDTHSHFHQHARMHYEKALGARNLQEYPIDWALIKTKADVLAHVSKTVKEFNLQPGEWIFLTSQNFYRNSKAPVHILYEELSMQDLDKAAPNNPIVISVGGGTIIFNGVCLLNGKAWDILWSKYGDFIKKYGRWWKDSGGNPTGLMEPPASKILEHELLPRPSAEMLRPFLKKEIEEWSAMGVTTISTRIGSDDVEALRTLDGNNELKVRVPYGIEDFFAVEDPEALFKRMGNLTGLGSSKLWVTSITPIVADGTGPRMPSDQKRLEQFGPEDKYWPMGQPLQDPEYRGASRNYYKEWFTALARSGNRVANMHTAGDRTIRQLLDTLEEIDREVPIKGRRFAFDHCTLVNPDHIERAVRLGIYFSCAPVFVKDSPTLERVYGQKVANTMVVPIKTMLNKGAKVVFEMDAHSYIWENLEIFLTRKVEGKVYGPEERIDKVTALKMITSWAAEYVLKEKELGSLETGKKADLVVLDRDYLNTPEEEISEVQALMTICDGEMVYLHPTFSREYNLNPPGATVATFKELFARR